MIWMATIVEAAKKQELIDQHVILFRKLVIRKSACQSMKQSNPIIIPSFFVKNAGNTADKRARVQSTTEQASSSDQASNIDCRQSFLLFMLAILTWLGLVFF